MSAVTWLCALCVVLAFVAMALGYVTVGMLGVVGGSLLAWYDWREFGTPPASQHWGNRFGPSPPDDGSGGSKVPASVRRGPAGPGASAALPLPDDGED